MGEIRAMLSAAGACLLFLISTLSLAGGYPEKPLKIIVPWAAGAAWDVRVRQLAEIVSKSMGQQVIVDNRPGGGGTLGADVVAKSPPDGYTILAGSQADQILAAEVNGNVPYDASRDFAPVTQVVSATFIMLASNTLEARTASEMIARARKAPGQLTFASTGFGTLTHLLLAELNHAAGVEITHVPYKSAPAGLADVVAGRVSLMLDLYTTSGQFIQTGKVRPLFVAAAKRHRALPDVPTAAEVGLPTVSKRGWGGFFVPAKTPKDIVQRLSKEFALAAQSPSFRQSLEAAGADVVTSSPEEFEAFLRSEREELRRLVKLAGAKVE